MATQIVLRTDVARVGKAGETVGVSTGFARNFLIPKGLAWLATEGTLKHVKKEVMRASAKKAKVTAVATELAHKLEKVEVTMKKAAGDNGKLFGTVTAAEIAKALQAQQFNVDRRTIKLTEPIKALGVYTVAIHLAPEVEAKVKVWVNKE